LRLIIRLIQFVLWVVVATWLGRKLFGWLFEAGRVASQDETGGSAPGGANRGAASSAPTGAGVKGGVKGRKLHRDPVCGTHVPESVSVAFEHRGQVLHFCSVDCRDKFTASARATQSSRAGAASA